MKKIILSILTLTLSTLVNADIQHYFAVPENTDVAGFISSSTNPTLDNSERLVSEDSTGEPLYAVDAPYQSTATGTGNLLYYTTTNNAATIIQNLLAANPIYANADGTVAIDIYHFVENTEDSIFNDSGAFVYYNSSEITENRSIPSSSTSSIRNLTPKYGAEREESNEVDDSINNKDDDINTNREFAVTWGVTGTGVSWDGLNTNLIELGYGVCGDGTVECVGGGQFALDSPQRLFTIDLKLTATITATNLNVRSSVSTENEGVNYNFVINKALPVPVLANHPAQIYTVDTQITTPLRFTNTGGVGLTSCNSNPPLPTGLSVDPSTDVSTCEISGTPSAVSSATTYTITATNSAGSGTATVNITVNLAAPIISLSTTTITAIAGSAISNITVINSGGTPTSYAISPAIDNGLSFSTTTGTISGIPTAVTVATYTVTATNSGGSGSATLSITVLDNAPTGITLSNDNISENAGANVIVGTFSTIDPDFGTHTYTLNNTATFSISGDTLIANNSFDFETQSLYNITVTTTDKDSKSFSKDFTITVNDTDEPIITSTNTFTVLAGKTIVATLIATTEDGNVATFSTYISGTNAASFTLTAAGALTFNNPAVYDTYNIIVKSVNANGTATQAITINVLTQSTFNVGTNTITLTENAANTIRHQVNITAIDEDNSASNSTFAVSATGGIFTTNPVPVVSFSNSSIDSTAALSSTVQTATLYFTIIPDTTGTGTITITLTDENNDVTSKTLTVIVNQANKTPIISQDIATYIDTITDTISRKYGYQNDAAIFGGSLYFSLSNIDGAKFADFVALQSSFNTDAHIAHIAIVDSEQERLFFDTLSGGTFDTYLGVASGTETGFGAVDSGNWYSVLGDFILFDSSPTAANGEQYVPGRFNLTNTDNADDFANGPINSCLRYSFGVSNANSFNDRPCDDAGDPNGVDDGFFELPSGLPALNQASFTLNQTDTFTQVATLSGFDLDGDSITWSYSDSADGTATFTNNSAINTGVSSTTVDYQPAADFIGTTTLSIILTDSNNNSATMTINITVNPAAPDISLSTTTITATARSAISNITVTNSGGDATYSISPAIDNALSFDTTDGTISGTPANAATNVVYTVTATNITGSSTATLNISVNPEAPNISLSTTTITATARSAISNITVTNSGGDATYSISPAIGNGLSFDTTDGTISGTPANVATNVVYTITASNVSGNSTATVNITVNPAAPDISLSTTTVVASVATAITAITVSNDGGTATYSISPALSEGLSFATNTGTISGTPSATATLQVYTITASNVTNSDSATLSITVNPAAPNISLSTTTITATARSAISNITVTNSGGDATYSISPAIDNDLSFATTDGTISGTPSATAILQIYTITASNITNSDSATLSITVNPAAPNISLSTTTITAIAGSAISNITVTNNGGDATYSISPAIDNGLSFDTTDGTISGTPANAATNVVYTITASNISSNSTATLNITVNPVAPDISLSTTTVVASVATAITAITVSNDGGTATYSISPTLSEGLSFATTDGTISGTPSATAILQIYTITASNITNSDSATLSITVNPAAPNISLSTTTITATARSAISNITVTNSGGDATYSISPAIGNDLSFDTTDGTISGTPSAAATLQVYTITASNVTNSDSATLSITVNLAAPSIELSVDTVNAGIRAIANITVINTGGTATYSISPAITNGLSFNTANGTISGTPSATATAIIYTVTATNISGTDSASVSITVSQVTIAPSIEDITNTQTYFVGVAISSVVFTNAGDLAQSCVSNPDLPAGLNAVVSGDSCAINGEAEATKTLTTYTITATNSFGSDTATINIAVTLAIPNISLSTTTTTITAIAGSAINNITVTNNGGDATYSISPAIDNGLSFDTADGTISGTPANAATNVVYTITASNVSGNSTATLSITVNPAAPDISLSTTTVVASVATAITAITVSNDGGTATYSISPSLSEGLSFATNTGTISGTPSTTATLQVYTITASNVTNSDSATLSITVNPAAPNISLSTTTITATARSAISNIIVTNSGGDATYSISPAIDNGLSFDTTDGTISGTPANAATNVVYTITASNISGNSTATLNITVNPVAPDISLSTTTVVASVATAITAITVSNDGGTATYSISPALSEGLSFATNTGTISGTPANAATNVVYTVTATNVTNSDSATLSITVNPAAPIISLSVSTLTATAGTAISNITVTNSGGDATYSISPAIDNALSFDTTDGTISGTPSAAATLQVYTITASNVSGNSTATLSITVNLAAPSIELSVDTVNAGIRAIANITVINTGGTATYSISPAITNGLSFNTTTGTISGTPSATATAIIYTVTATNISGTDSASVSITVSQVTIAPSIEDITNTQTYFVGVAISTVVFTNAGDLAQSCVSNPDLPAGLNAVVSGDSCAINGEAEATKTLTTYTITATNLFGSDTATINIAVTLAIPNISLSTTTITAIAGSAINNITVTNNGGDATYSISPAIGNDLSFNTTDGTISGTPANAATNVVYTVTASNVSGNSTATVNITVNPAAPDISLSTTTVVASVAIAITVITVSNDGGTATYSISPSLSEGLSFATNTGTISGTPSTTATLQVYTITASNVTNSDSATLSITVNPAAPNISLSTTTITATARSAISNITVTNSGGDATYSISPAIDNGLSFDTTDGTISGTPSAAATLQVYTITASNVTNSDSATLSITVNLAAPSIELSVATVNVEFNVAIANITVINTGGTATYSISPAITNGLSFNTTTGTISGTPSATATAIIYTVTATNISGTDSASVSITVSQVTIAPSIEDITNTQTYFVGVAISSVVFTNAGDLAQSCVSNPDLPAGLNAVVSGDSCAINGEAEATKTLTTYTITATNSFGSDTATINIAVTLAIPNISLSTTTITAIAGSAINNITVTNNGGDATYSISPAIDNGLSFDTADGTISGTPANAATNVVYTVTASNVSGNSTATVNITVNPAAPDISLSTTTVVASVATAITAITVSNDGGTATYSISPALSEGLSFATNTGTISGTPSATAILQVYTITASNVTNSDSATLSITVNLVAITFSLDADGNQTLNATNDGLIIFKYLLNPDANNLHTTIANDAIESRKTSAQLKAYLDNAGTILDVDGNQTLNATNDGLIIFKYLLNPDANNLHTTIANDAIESRKTTTQLKDYLDKYK